MKDEKIPDFRARDMWRSHVGGYECWKELDCSSRSGAAYPSLVSGL